MKCIIIINKLSGHFNKRNVKSKIEELSHGFETFIVYLDKKTQFPDIKEYNRVAVFGGDGTLNSFLNAEKSNDQELFYFPIGTLNESAKNYSNSISDCLCVNGKNVAYVCACGIFTPLGYNTKTRSKKRFKALAYIFNVIKEYKISRISACVSYTKSEENKQYRINNNQNNENIVYQNGFKNKTKNTKSIFEQNNDDNNNKLSKVCNESNQNIEYALVMCIKSKTCFGFKFNRIYDRSDGFELLTIKSPKHNGILGKIELFFPLFKCFFIGFNKEYSNKNVLFQKVNAVNIQLDEKTAFCLDGEKAELKNEIVINTNNIQEIKILNS